MRVRSVTVVLFTIALFTAIGFSLMRATQPIPPTPQTAQTLHNIRTFAAASEAGGTHYAVDGGLLYSGTHGQWIQVSTPPGVIVSAVVIQGGDAAREPAAIIIGAANAMTLLYSVDAGQHWEKRPLSHEFIGGVTDVALDASQSTIFVGTDTAGIFQVHVAADNQGNVQLTTDDHWMHDKPIVQLATHEATDGMVFARTDWELLSLRHWGATNSTPQWQRVVGIDSTPTDVVVVPGDPATVYVGTEERGVLRSWDGVTWFPFNTGLDMGAGVQLRVDALAADPAQPGVLYVATSHVLGSRERQHQPAGLAYVARHELPWVSLSNASTTPEANVAGLGEGNTISALLPVSGNTGAVYALTTHSRSPVALGSAPPIAMISSPAAAAEVDTAKPLRNTVTWSWAIAGLAGLAFLYAVFSDLRRSTVYSVRAVQPQRTDS